MKVEFDDAAAENEYREVKRALDELRKSTRTRLDLLHGRLGELARKCPSEAVYCACDAVTRLNGSIDRAMLP